MRRKRMAEDTAKSLTGATCILWLLGWSMSSFAFGENRLRSFWTLPRPTRARPRPAKGLRPFRNPFWRLLGLMRELFRLWRKSLAGFLGFAQTYEGAALDLRRDFVPFETHSLSFYDSLQQQGKIINLLLCIIDTHRCTDCAGLQRTQPCVHRRCAMETRAHSHIRRA